jgi:aerobic-type carbon monoxide dehydrogenase small subunit (CoxS/CutS family)
VVVVDLKNTKINGGNCRCTNYKKLIIIIIDVKNTKNEWW